MQTKLDDLGWEQENLILEDGIERFMMKKHKKKIEVEDE